MYRVERKVCPWLLQTNSRSGSILQQPLHMYHHRIEGRNFPFHPVHLAQASCVVPTLFLFVPLFPPFYFFILPFFFLLAVVETETWNFFNETKDILFICWSCFHLFSKSPQHRANLNVYIFEKGLFKLRINMYSYVRTLFANDSFSKLSCYPVVE